MAPPPAQQHQSSSFSSGTQALDAALRRAPNPFADSALRSAHEVLGADVRTLQSEVFEGMQRTIERSRADGRSRLLPVLGDPGEGKTHLLSRLRRLAEDSFCDPAVPTFALGLVSPVRDPDHPFRHILRDAASSLGRLLPRIEPDGAQPQSQLERMGFLALARGIGHLARKDPSLDDWGHDKVPRYLASFVVRVRDEWPDRGQEIGERLLPWAQQHNIAPEVWQALCRLPDEASCQPALAWLRGSHLSESELSRHGLPPPIDDEDLAFRVIVSLANCSEVPLCLGFDQIEGIRRQSEEAVRRFFASLVELFNHEGRLVLLVFCQTSIWPEIRARLEQQVLDRMERSLRLRPLTKIEVVALCASRLYPVWRAAGLVPPYPTYPFPAEELMALMERERDSLRTPRRVLKYLEQVLDDRPQKSPLSAQERAQRAYAEALERERRAVFERSAEVRAATAQNALARALDAAWALHQEVFGVEVLQVEGMPTRQENPLRVQLRRGGQEMRRRIYIESSNSGHGQSAAATAKRLQRMVAEGECDVALWLREQAYPLPKSAAEVCRRAQEISVVWLHGDDLPPLSALEVFLNAAADNEVPPLEAAQLCAAAAGELSAVGKVVAAAFSTGASAPSVTEAPPAAAEGPATGPSAEGPRDQG